MNKFGQAEFAEFLAELFVNDKLENILETDEKKNFKRKNTEDIYMKFPSSRDVA